MKKVLVLDEDWEGREILAKILKKKGFQVVQAADTDSAMDYLTSSSPLDLVIAGVTDSDRTEFLSDLRERRTDLPVIFLSDYCAPESRLRGVRYGAFVMSRSLHFFINTRPIGFAEFDRIIRFALQGVAFSQERPLAA